MNKYLLLFFIIFNNINLGQVRSIDNINSIDNGQKIYKLPKDQVQSRTKKQAKIIGSSLATASIIAIGLKSWNSDTKSKEVNHQYGSAQLISNNTAIGSQQPSAVPQLQQSPISIQSSTQTQTLIQPTVKPPIQRSSQQIVQPAIQPQIQLSSQQIVQPSIQPAVPQLQPSQTSIQSSTQTQTIVQQSIQPAVQQKKPTITFQQKQKTNESIKQLIISEKNKTTKGESVDDILKRIKKAIINDIFKGEVKGIENQVEAIENYEYFYECDDKQTVVFSNKALNLIFSQELKETIAPKKIKKDTDFLFKNPQVLTPTNHTYNTLLVQYDHKKDKSKVFKLTYQHIQGKGDGHCLYNSMDASVKDIIEENNKKSHCSLGEFGDFYQHQQSLFVDKDTLLVNNLSPLMKKIDKATIKWNDYENKNPIVKQLKSLYTIFYHSFFEPQRFIGHLSALKNNDFLYPIKTTLEQKHPKTIEQLQDIYEKHNKNWNTPEAHKALIQLDEQYQLLNCDDIFPTISQLIEESLKQSKKNSNQDGEEKELCSMLTDIKSLIDNQNYLTYMKDFITKQLKPSKRLWGDTNLFKNIVKHILKNNVLKHSITNEIKDEKQIHYLMFNETKSVMQWNGDQPNFLKITEDFNDFSWEDFKKFNCILYNGSNHFDRVQLIHYEEITIK